MYYAVLDTVAVEPTFVAFLQHSQTYRSWSLIAILLNFFQKQWAKNPPQYLSGLSRALFPTTFLEIAVYKIKNQACSEGETKTTNKKFTQAN